MSRASAFAERFKQAVEVERAAGRAKDSITPVRLLLPAEVIEPDVFGHPAQSPKFERVVAYVTTEGKFAYEKSQGPLTPVDAVKLAFWILEVFNEGDDLPVGFHHLDCTIWKRSKGECSCGGIRPPGAL